VEIHLVDGTYELFRAHYGAPPALSPQGRQVGATLGLARSLLALLGREGATHVAVAFDHEIESFRNELFEGYKRGEGIEPALFEQFEPAERICRALGLVVWPMVEFEADDALATGASRYGEVAAVDRVLICTPDKDLAQCVVGRRIVGLDRRRSKLLDEEGVREKFGVSPAAIPDWLALVGDSADGIPGIPRWGARSAATLLGEYGSIEAIPQDHATWTVRARGAAALAQQLNLRRQEAALYRRLATLRRDVPLDESVEDLVWHGADRSELETLSAQLGAPGLMERVHRFRET